MYNWKNIQFLGMLLQITSRDIYKYPMTANLLIIYEEQETVKKSYIGSKYYSHL